MTCSCKGIDSLPDHIRRNFAICKDSGCWIWQRGKSPDGYGWASYNNWTYQAHRLLYTLLKGEIPKGLVIDHLCRNRACVNPAHMEPVTPGENIRRSPLTPAGQERCLKCGGEFSWVGKAKPQRRCLPCAKAWKRAYCQENKEHIREVQQRWNDANRDKLREIWRRHDAKRRRGE